mmetsp:Transcript_85666/g.195285  ORF Transcript_85666/g.195285 Transcript_85666/m.195285 type:complete len:202 (-) Transcript_85666:68-673(-)
MPRLWPEPGGQQRSFGRMTSIQPLPKPKIAQLTDWHIPCADAVQQQHILDLEVAVQNSNRMNMVEGAGDLSQNSPPLQIRKQSAPRELEQVSSTAKLHDQTQSRGRSDRIQRYHVLMRSHHGQEAHDPDLTMNHVTGNVVVILFHRHFQITPTSQGHSAPTSLSEIPLVSNPSWDNQIIEADVLESAGALTTNARCNLRHI